MKLLIQIKDDNGEVLAEHEYKADDHFDLEILDWEQDKHILISKTLSNNETEHAYF